MIYKQPGTTTLNPSIIGVGTWQFSGEWGHNLTGLEVSIILETAESLGINLLDTAECYGNHLSENLIGRFLKQNKNRDKWIIATKFGHTYNEFLDVNDCWSSREVKDQLERSLRALCTDHIDIYQFHSGNNKDFDNDELWEMLQKEKQMGKIRYLGVSISEQAVIDNNLHQIYNAKDRGVDIVQIRYNWLNREAERVLLPLCAELKLGVLVRQPLAWGYLSGKYADTHQFPNNDVRHWLNKSSFLDDMKSVSKLRKNLGKSINVASWALEWCLKNQNIDSVLIGCKNVEQIKAGVEVINKYEHSNLPI